MVIFHSYVKLPEGNPAKSPRKFWITRGLEDLEVEAQKRGDLALAAGLVAKKNWFRRQVFAVKDSRLSATEMVIPSGNLT